jgi:hypothetical protein
MLSTSTFAEPRLPPRTVVELGVDLAAELAEVVAYHHRASGTFHPPATKLWHLVFSGVGTAIGGGGGGIFGGLGGGEPASRGFDWVRSWFDHGIAACVIG